MSLIERILKCINKQSQAGADYLRGYRSFTDRRSVKDSKRAIGGMWEEIGKLQFEFLVRRGLVPGSTLLDVGCGSLRGGRHFIRYLETGRYTGMDISEGILESAKDLLKAEQLQDKAPRLVFSSSGALDFTEVKPDRFDFVLAQSVLTHLPAAHVETCFANIPLILAQAGVFYFTFYRSDENRQVGPRTFAFREDWLVETAKANGLKFALWEHDYPHPKGQIMGSVSAFSDLVP